MSRRERCQPRHLRVVTEAHQSWFAAAEREAAAFIASRGHLLSDPSLAGWVLEQCAELAWERRLDGRAVAPDWAELRVDELWRRLDDLHRFFAQPRLVIAHYETLSLLLPWLCVRGALSQARCAALLSELERVGTHAVRRAERELAARSDAGTSSA